MAGELDERKQLECINTKQETSPDFTIGREYSVSQKDVGSSSGMYYLYNDYGRKVYYLMKMFRTIDYTADTDALVERKA